MQALVPEVQGEEGVREANWALRAWAARPFWSVNDEEPDDEEEEEEEEEEPVPELDLAGAGEDAGGFAAAGVDAAGGAGAAAGGAEEPDELLKITRKQNNRK